MDRVALAVGYFTMGAVATAIALAILALTHNAILIYRGTVRYYKWTARYYGEGEGQNPYWFAAKKFRANWKKHSIGEVWQFGGINMPVDIRVPITRRRYPYKD